MGRRVGGLQLEDIRGSRTLFWTCGGPVTFTGSSPLFWSLKSGRGSSMNGSGGAKGTRTIFLYLHDPLSPTYRGMSLPMSFSKRR